MITNKVEEARNWDFKEHLSCENCGRTDDLHRIFVKNGIKNKEMCFCTNCWAEILEAIWPGGDYRQRRKNK